MAAFIMLIHREFWWDFHIPRGVLITRHSFPADMILEADTRHRVGDALHAVAKLTRFYTFGVALCPEEPWFLRGGFKIVEEVGFKAGSGY